jgi:hypothetical protein
MLKITSKIIAFELKNRYVKNAKISEAKFCQLLRYFALDLDAGQIAELSNLSRNTINRYLKEIRTKIAEYCEETSPVTGEIEVDESFFGARRVKGKRGRGASGKTIVFGLYKRNGKVYTEIVPDCSRATLQGVIRGHIELGSVIHSDGWPGYNGLVDVGYEKHFRVDHLNNEFVRGKVHINGIEGFWGFSKSRLAKFKGVPKHTFYLHLKECEFRYNFKNQNIYKVMMKILRERTLF